MKINFFSIIILFFFIKSCQEPHIKVKKNECDCLRSNITKITFIEKEAKDDEHNDMINSACDSWYLSKEEVFFFLQEAIPISSEEYVQIFYDMPCSMRGVLFTENNSYHFSINAASKAIIKNEKLICFYGCIKNECEKLFLINLDSTERQAISTDN